MTSRETSAVLAERLSRDGRVRWQARISEDRGRLEVVGIVAPSDAATVIEPLSGDELRELLVTTATPDTREHWICLECRTANEPWRRWCRICSSHAGCRR
jgi:hypothetical protein